LTGELTDTSDQLLSRLLHPFHTLFDPHHNQQDVALFKQTIFLLHVPCWCGKYKIFFDNMDRDVNNT